MIGPGRQQMQHALVLAEHTDHLLRFSFIGSIRVERPSAGNDQRKMVVPRYGAPQSVCLPEIALGLGLSTVRSHWSHIWQLDLSALFVVKKKTKM
ncbi:hypothetical protein NQZ68_029422 [Dissostichus eleginoides]|nr:hypothetical protein NQZ68_029422 [Dissostichus eleginoides]